MKTQTFIPAFSQTAFRFATKPRSSNLWYATLQAPATLVAHIRDHVSHAYAGYALTPGLHGTKLPLNYTQQYFSAEIERDAKQFIFDNFIQESIIYNLDERKIHLINWPRLIEVQTNPDGSYLYTFAISVAPQITVNNWKNNTYLPPRRKNYTDLDIQVASFIQQLGQIAPPSNASLVEHGDWVKFSSCLRSPHTSSPLQSAITYWVHIATANIPTRYTEALMGKSVGSRFMLPATDRPLEGASAPYAEYYYDVTVLSIIKNDYLSLPDLAACLEVPSTEMIPDRLIEIFSFRNDASLRHAIVEELFYLLFSVYRFDVAPHAITRRKELLLTLMQHAPESTIYAKQKQFLPHIALHAEVRLKEEALIDAIATHENTQITDADIRHYIQLSSHERLRDFVYFTPLADDLASSYEPLSEQQLLRIVRREKTLNAVIAQLSI